MASLNSGPDSLSFTFPDALPQPSVSGPVATYRNVLPGTDLQLTANASGFSELLIIHDRAAAANPALRSLRLGMTARGVTVTGSPDGGAQATTASGATVFHADTASMWDSAQLTVGDSPSRGQQAQAATIARTGLGRVAPVTVHVSHGAETLAPSMSLLDSPKTIFPVYIDPAWSGNPSQLDWARISSACPDNTANEAAGDVGEVWSIYNSSSTAATDHPRSGYDDWTGGCDEVARTFYGMNTSGIAYTHVASASLFVVDNFSAYSSSTNMNLYSTAKPTDNGWNSTDLDWSNQPSAGTLQDGGENQLREPAGPSPPEPSSSTSSPARRPPPRTAEGS